jgi:hypothetical protein
MSLTTALLALAAVLLLAVLVHGWWQTRRAARQAQPARSAAGGGSRVEPALDGAGDSALDAALHDSTLLPEEAAADAAEADDADDPAGPVTRPMRLEPEDAPAAAPPLASPPLRRRSLRNPPLDALIDALVTLVLDAPVSGDAVLAHLPPTRRAGSKPFYVEGLDTETGEWDTPQPGRRYGELQAGVQLANRHGALNEIEYSEFVQKVEAFAEAVGARADLPDMLEVVARARELDGLASPLDAQLTLTLRANGVAWSVPYLQQVAGRLGFVTGAVPGRLVLPADEPGAPPLLVLNFDAQAALAVQAGDPPGSALREAALVLDLAQTAEALEPYPAWHRTATALADDLDATPVDDYGQPLTLQAFSAIGREVAQVYERLRALDLPAGSPAARRLFS